MIGTKIPKFRRFVLQNFPFIEQDFDALTDYELICKVVEYLNKVIDQTNSLTDATSNLITAFNDLQEYVANYFENLDVQEEINTKLDKMVEDGTFASLIAPYIDKINYIRVSDYYDEGDYINLQTLYDTAIASHKNIYIDGEFKIKHEGRCEISNGYIEIYGGKLTADSYENGEQTSNIFTCNNPCYIHDIEIVSTNNKIPSINYHAGLDYGYASNVYAVSVHSDDVTIENIKGDFISGVKIYGDDTTRKNIKINKCHFEHCELGIYCEKGSFSCTNSTYIQSTDIQSIYYHPFYIAQATDSIFENITIGSNDLVYPNVNLTEYILNDVFHIYNSSDAYEGTSKNIIINNVNIITGSKYYRLAHCRYIDNVIFSNINGQFENTIIQLGNRYNNVAINDSNITINDASANNGRVIYNNNSYTTTATDNLTLNNCIIRFVTGGTNIMYFCNATFNSCQIISNSDLTIPYSNALTGYLKFNNCYIKLNRLRNLYKGSGKIDYVDCYFDNSDVNNYINSGQTDTLNIRVVNCYFAKLKHMFETEMLNSNVFYNVYGYSPDRDNYRHIFNYEDIDAPSA